MDILRLVAMAMLASSFLATSGCLNRSLEAAENQYECEYNGAIDSTTGALYDPETTERPSPKPIVKRLEFTDEGEVVNRCAWSDALFEVKGLPSQSQRNPKLIVFYIHGWKHDNSNDDEDLKQFTKLVQELDSTELSRERPRDVIGIFISWPGKSLNIPILENLSFWGRKGGADRVSAAGNVTKFISSAYNASRIQNNKDDYIVGIGHSFGARILYSSVSPILLHAMAVSHPGARLGTYGKIHGSIDLTILLNPAFEASKYTAIDASRRHQEEFNEAQPPLVLTISTETDLATKFAFPLGQIFGTRWRARERTTLGNYGAYRTHYLQEQEGSSSIDGVWYDNFCTSGLCLVRDNPISGFPFIFAKTNGSVLPGHNGIWEPPFTKWLADFIEMSSDQRIK